jgi:hypothetical protein
MIQDYFVGLFLRIGITRSRGYGVRAYPERDFLGSFSGLKEAQVYYVLLAPDFFILSQYLLNMIHV